MSTETPTQLLTRIRLGDDSCVRSLFALVYDELRTIARRQLHGNSLKNDLSSAELVHEAYMKLIDAESIDLKGRSHFFALGARAMRQILVDRARANQTTKRGGAYRQLAIDDQLLTRQDDEHVLMVEDALQKLEEIDPAQAKIVELRFYGSMTVDEVAQFLNKSKRWVESEWTMIRAWLRAELSEGESL